MIRIQDMKKEYPDFFLRLSLELPKGRVTGIVGRNGAGKSTAIKAILGLIRADSGSVTVLGVPAEKLTGREKQRMGAALAESGFSSYLNIRGVRSILKAMYPEFDGAYFDRLVCEQKLPQDKLIKDFSTGMKAKLRVLAAITHRAELLILDEPTAGLDVIARNEILDMLRAYMTEDENRAILITSHISTDLEGLCDDIYMIHNGEVILHEDTDVLLGSYAVLKVNPAMYEKMDKTAILTARETNYGYACLTAEKQFYAENYPDMVIENGSIDELIVMLASSPERRNV